MMVDAKKKKTKPGEVQVRARVPEASTLISEDIQIRSTHMNIQG